MSSRSYYLSFMKNNHLAINSTRALQKISLFSTSIDKSKKESTPTTTALIIGSSGALGSSVVSHFRQQNIVSNIIGVDLVMPPTEHLAKSLDHFISLDVAERDMLEDGVEVDIHSLAGLTYMMTSGLEDYESSLQQAGKEEPEEFEDDNDGEDSGADAIPLDAIICTAGGFIPTMDYSSEDFILGVEEMLSQNLYPVIAASHIASTRLKPGGT